MALTIAAAQKKSALDNIYDNLNTGFLRIYSGTRPTNPDTALSGNTLLASLTFGATAFAAATGTTTVTKTANAIGSDTNAPATGTASFFRAFKSDGTTAVLDGTVGTSGTDAIINSTSIVAATTVACTSLVITAGG
jgi:xanthine/uracil/vitamin C permease (AzgA family)